jgi:hypothetical protein
VFDEAILPRVAGVIYTKPVVGDAAEHVGEPSLLATLCADQRVVGGGALRPRSDPVNSQTLRPSAYRATQVQRRVAQADAAVVEEAGNALQALQYLIDYLGDFRQEVSCTLF